MIRVGFVFETLLSSEWLGGANYYHSLLSVLEMLEDRKLQLVLFVPSKNAAEMAARFPTAVCVSCAYFDSGTVQNFVWKVCRRIFGVPGFHFLLLPLIARHRIDVLSHFGVIGRWSRTKSIGWIPDFQHVNLPQFFSSSERASRDALSLKTIRRCDLIVVSSDNALSDLKRFSPDLAWKARVLRFVPDVRFADSTQHINVLESKYMFKGPYFHLPNQFWIHKNHAVVIRAIGNLRDRGIAVTVIATGRGYDYRNPGYFEGLMHEMRRLNLADSFRTLGVVPYSDLLSLMRHSIAVINPSLFEGWSTTVEEAKALGKKVLLSDIAVHKEQSPEYATFFGPEDTVGLADAMLDAMRSADSAVVADAELEAAHTQRRVAFAKRYEEIVSEVG